MELTHRLLKRQVKRHLGSSEAIPAELENLMASVQEAYEQFETDYSTLERALELSSQELREANSGMRAVNERLVQSSLNGVFAFDRECRYTVWNPAMKKFFNMNNLQTIGKYAFDLFPQLKKEGLDSLYYEALTGSTTSILERPYLNAYTGEQGFMEAFFAPLFSEGGSIIGGLGVVHDITERKRSEEALRRQHEYLQVLQEMALRLSGKEELDGFFEDILQRACQLLETPHAFMTLIEPTRSMLTNRFSTGIFKDLAEPGSTHNEKLVARVRLMREPMIISNYQYLVDLELGSLRNWISVPLFQGNEIVGVIGAAYTEEGRCAGEAEIALLKQFAQLASIGLVHEALHEANTQLAALATVDPLTNLPNHRTAVGRIEETLAHCYRVQEECAVLFLDIDHFKSINDTWGHQAGDTVLREVGQRLTSNMRKEDFVGRYGGEEFAIVLPAMDLEAAAQTAERLRLALNTIPCFWETEKGGPVLPIPITASIGVAIYRQHGVTREELLEAADQAMYQAKRRGRNRVCIAGEQESLKPEVSLVEPRQQQGSVNGGSVLSALIAAASAHDQGTSEHTLRTVHLAKATAEKLGCSPEVVYLVSQAALLHDIGKIGIPDAILHKEASLTEDEWAIMRRHPHIGSQILTEAGGVYSLLAHIVGAHHERWDGMGYPHKMQEESIPLGARILSVVDSYDAMTSDRPYRKALSKEAAREELLRCAGSQFDPKAVAAFIQVLDEAQTVAPLAMTA
jgi:diguanylate cyclase (GGDEF)-like protein/PAS domain S-box-containing protein/putative nucleotidyltransferase with HDIG domain